jgi:hypothetical protein
MEELSEQVTRPSGLKLQVYLLPKPVAKPAQVCQLSCSSAEFRAHQHECAIMSS